MVKGVSLRAWRLAHCIWPIALRRFALGALFAHACCGTAAVRLDAFVGYDGILTQGGFFPAVFEIYNDGPAFNAVIELTPAQFGQGQTRQIPVELPTGTLKRLSVPVFSAQQYGVFNWNVRLLDEKHRVRLETNSRQIRKNNPFGVPLLAAVSRTTPVLPEIKAGNQDLRPIAARLQPDLFPDNPIALESLDTIYLSTEKALDLKVNQVNALRAWLNSGGHLVIGVEQIVHLNGLDWLRELLPCELSDLTTVQSHGALQEWVRSDATRSGKPMFVSGENFSNPYRNLSSDDRFENRPIQIATGKRLDGRVLIGDERAPFAFAAARGRGQITVLTFSPELEPFASWSQRAWFWSKMSDLPPELLEKTEYNAYAGYSIDGVFGAMIDSRQIRKLPVGWLLLLLVGYLVVIGPLDRYWLKKIGKQMLTWITFPIYVAFFSGLIYFIGYKLRAGETEWNELQVVDILPVGERAALRGHTFASVYSPVNATYRVSSSEPLATLRGEFMRSGGGQETSRALIRQKGNSFEADVSVPVWTSQLFVSEWWKQASLPLQLTVRSHGDDYQVTIQNLLQTPLQNVIVAIDRRVYTIGDLKAGQKNSITLSKRAGEPLDNFVQSYGAQFQQVVNQRHQAFGSDASWRITDIPRSSMAASFVSRLRSKRYPQQNQYYYGYNYAVTPPGFDLSEVVERGDAVLLAWAPGFTMSKPMNQFPTRRSRNDSLLRISTAVEH